MNIKKIQIVANIIFVLLAGVGFYYAKVLSTPDTEPVTPEDFVILMENSEISALHNDGTYLWVGTSDGVFAYNPDTLIVEQEITDLSLVYSAGITSTPDGSLWIGHEGGLCQIDAAGNRTDYTTPELPKGRVNTVFFDGEILWCGTYYGGAAFTQQADGSWQISQLYYQENGLCCDAVNVITAVEGGLMIGSYLETTDGGLTFFAPDASGTLVPTQTIGLEQGLPHPYITSILSLPDGEVLVGMGYMTDGALAILRYDGTEYAIDEIFTAEDDLPGAKIRSLFYADGLVWITTEYDGVMITPKEEFLAKDFSNSWYLQEQNGLSDNEIKCIAQTETDYWLGGKYGVTLIAKSEIAAHFSEYISAQ